MYILAKLHGYCCFVLNHGNYNEICVISVYNELCMEWCLGKSKRAQCHTFYIFAGFRIDIRLWTNKVRKKSTKVAYLWRYRHFVRKLVWYNYYGHLGMRNPKLSVNLEVLASWKMSFRLSDLYYVQAGSQIIFGVQDGRLSRTKIYLFYKIRKKNFQYG